MDDITALMPCRGRINETLELVPRLFQTAGLPFRLICVVDGERLTYDRLCDIPDITVLYHQKRMGYWQCLHTGILATDAPLIVNLANDLLPGLHWLLRARQAYQQVFDFKPGLIGFNDGIHVGEHAAHFLVHRGLLHDWYGDDYFPLMYQHLYGDTEISRRAIEANRFAVAHFAVLYHNHPYAGRMTDKVYYEGEKTSVADAALYEQRRDSKWA